MKKIIKSLGALLYFAPVTALAAIVTECPDNNPACNKDLTVLITSISNTILLLVGIVAVLFLIIGGFQYIASAGNAETIAKAKSTILYAIIGIGVTLLSWAAVTFIITKLGSGA